MFLTMGKFWGIWKSNEILELLHYNVEEGDVLVGPGAVFLSGFCQFNYEIFRLVQNPVCKQLQYGARFLYLYFAKFCF